MSDRIVLSIDAMGGDFAPESVIGGVKRAHARLPDVDFLLFGDERRINDLLTDDPTLRARCTVRHTDEVVKDTEKASQAVRGGRKTSMWLAIEAVKKGEAHGVVSAGNTGALMGMALLQLRTIPGIDRPAIATVLPTIKGQSVVLDLGANAECDAKNLVDFAIMGEVFARAVLKLDKPKVGILNIGSEDQKGHYGVRTAAETLRASDLAIDFHGFVEGDDIGKGTVDVVVTDGFTGNVALKTAEGTARLYTHYLRAAFSSSLSAKLGYLLVKPVFKRVRTKLDPRHYNGAMFLGLKGVCVKSHGGTDDVGFANAIGVAADLVTNDFNSQIHRELEHLGIADDGSDAKVAAG